MALWLLLLLLACLKLQFSSRCTVLAYLSNPAGIQHNFAQGSQLLNEAARPAKPMINQTQSRNKRLLRTIMKPHDQGWTGHAKSTELPDFSRAYDERRCTVAWHLGALAFTATNAHHQKLGRSPFRNMPIGAL